MSSGGARAKIHDLGYRRYEGARRPQSSRWRVLVRNVVGTSWRGWWNMKVWVIGASTTVVAFGLWMYLARNKFYDGFARASARMSDGPSIPTADALLPLSFTVFTKLAFILTLTVCARIVSKDLKTGAFEFYFSRPLRAIDYVVGKLVGAMLVIGCALFVGPVLLSIFRIAIAKNTDQIPNMIWLIPKTMAAATIATFTYAAIPLAFSAVSSNARYAIAAWAVYHLIISNIAVIIAAKNPGAGAVGALNVSDSLMSVIYRIYDVKRMSGYSPPLWSAISILVVYFAVGFGVVYWRVNKAQRSGMGG